MRDESICLRALQTVMTIMQCPSFAGDEDGVRELLGLLFRILVSNRASSSIQVSAASAIRQAFSLVIEHAVAAAAAPAAPPAPTVSELRSELFGDSQTSTSSGGAPTPAAVRTSFSEGNGFGGSRTLNLGPGSFQGDPAHCMDIILHLLNDLLVMASHKEHHPQLRGDHLPPHHSHSHLPPHPHAHHYGTPHHGSRDSSASGASYGAQMSGSGVGPLLSPENAHPPSAASAAALAALAIAASSGGGGGSASNSSHGGGLWLRCPSPPRLFALELLETVLDSHAELFQRNAQLSALLRDKVGAFGGAGSEEA